MTFSIAPLPLKRTASRILAAAVGELFPHSEYVHAEETSLGFFAKFIFPFHFDLQMLPLVEEKMREIAKEQRPLKHMEMVPSVAVGFLKHHGKKRRAESLKNRKDLLIDLVLLGDFADICAPPYLEHTGEATWFKLLEVTSQGNEVSLQGVVFSEKAQLKAALKHIAAYPSKDHTILGRKLNLFSRERGKWIWHPEGASLREKLLALWKGECLARGFVPLYTGSSSLEEMENAHRDFFQSQGTPRTCEGGYFTQENKEDIGLFQCKRFFAERMYAFCGKEDTLEEVVSSLQSILKNLKMCDLKYQVVVCRPKALKESLCIQAVERLECPFTLEDREHTERVEVRIEDGLGREWQTAFVEVKEKCVVSSLWGTMERWIALCIEANLYCKKESF